MKRIRHCVNSNEVAHLWAHKAQDTAWERGRRFYFEGDTIYSYGSHFPIARHVKVNGVNCIFLTTRSYSPTTSGHKTCVQRAIPETIPVVMVEHPTIPYTPKEIEKIMVKDLTELWAKIPRARDNKRWLLARGKYQFSRYVEICKSLKLKQTVRLLPDWWILEEEKAKVWESKAEERKVEKQKRWKEKHQEEMKEYHESVAAWNAAIPIWCAGKINTLPQIKQGMYIYNHTTREMSNVEGAYLRINPDNPLEVETTLDARCPLEHVQRALPFVLSIIRAGKTYKTNGRTIHLGPYTLDEITSDGTVVVGCHRFNRGEVERFARTLKERTGTLVLNGNEVAYTKPTEE